MSNENEGLVESSNYHDYWRELTDHICKLVQLTRTITTQLENQRGQVPLYKHISKVVEEALEVQHANTSGTQAEFNEENMDLLFAVLATIHRGDLTDQNIKFAVGTCLTKFHKRGWLKF